MVARVGGEFVDGEQDVDPRLGRQLHLGTIEANAPRVLFARSVP